MESLDNDRNKQHQSLQQKIAEKKRMRSEALKNKHGSEMAKELLEQKKEMADAERNAVINLISLFFILILMKTRFKNKGLHLTISKPVSYTHLTLPTIYSV